jgi:ribosomal protein S18 acetylase RimI-like enzyme
LEERELQQQTLDLFPAEPVADTVAVAAPLPFGDPPQEDEIAAEEPGEDDWRFNNARSLRGCTLLRSHFRSAHGSEIEHCIGCWAKFSESGGADMLDEGYCTYTQYDWVCGNCYEELRQRMQWTRKVPARIAELLTTGGGRIRHAHEPAWIPTMRELLLEYEKSLGIDLHFQDFEREVANLPGEYNLVLGQGCLLLATIDGKPAGMVACRAWKHHLQDAICEMKRLYVRPDYRGTGLGEALARAVIDEARRLGYTRMRLDSLPFMDKAIRLYESLGFQHIEPYRANPVEDSVFLELAL